MFLILALILITQVHEVEDDITSCRTELMTKCRDVTVGYVTKPECDEVSQEPRVDICHQNDPSSGRWKDAHWRESW